MAHRVISRGPPPPIVYAFYCVCGAAQWAETRAVYIYMHRAHVCICGSALFIYMLYVGLGFVDNMYDR